MRLRQGLLLLLTVTLALTGCTGAPQTSPTVSPNFQPLDDTVSSEPAQRHTLPEPTASAEPTFTEVQLEIFTGAPLPGAVGGECIEQDTTPRCFGDDNIVYEKCFVDPYGSGQAACPMTSIDDLVVIDAGLPGFDPAQSYAASSQRPVGIAEVIDQTTGEELFCTVRTGGTGFEGPPDFPFWVGVCHTPSITTAETSVFWMSNDAETSDANVPSHRAYWTDLAAEQPEIAYVIHGPGHNPDDVYFADIQTWYY